MLILNEQNGVGRLQHWHAINSEEVCISYDGVTAAVWKVATPPARSANRQIMCDNDGGMPLKGHLTEKYLRPASKNQKQRVSFYQLIFKNISSLMYSLNYAH